MALAGEPTLTLVLPLTLMLMEGECRYCCCCCCCCCRGDRDTKFPVTPSMKNMGELLLSPRLAGFHGGTRASAWRGWGLTKSKFIWCCCCCCCCCSIPLVICDRSLLSKSVLISNWSCSLNARSLCM
ncbi:hypothetical protein B0T26DRAFT_704803, partial [Lasiosphaeria miniovina]